MIARASQRARNTSSKSGSRSWAVGRNFDRAFIGTSSATPIRCLGGVLRRRPGLVQHPLKGDYRHAKQPPNLDDRNLAALDRSIGASRAQAEIHCARFGHRQGFRLVLRFVGHFAATPYIEMPLIVANI